MSGRPFRTPALDAWRAELARGDRTTLTFDAVWRAACWEQSALEAAAVGLEAAALRDLHCAREVIEKAIIQAATT
jgi:hypothetical protein